MDVEAIVLQAFCKLVLRRGLAFQIFIVFESTPDCTNERGSNNLNQNLAKWANHLYRISPTLYWPVYSLYKPLSDRRERQLLRLMIRPGMVAVDVGANVGTSAIFLLELVLPLFGGAFQHRVGCSGCILRKNQAEKDPCLAPKMISMHLK
jgi:hypothetical protein